MEMRIYEDMNRDDLQSTIDDLEARTEYAKSIVNSIPFRYNSEEDNDPEYDEDEECELEREADDLESDLYYAKDIFARKFGELY